MRRLSKYLVWAFGGAWILQIAAGLLFQNGYRIGYYALLSLSMFAPLLAAVVSGYGLRQLGLRPQFRKNLCWLPIAWFLPIVLGTMGAVLYFLVTPNALDTTFSYATDLLGADGLRQLEANGLSLKQYAVISTISAVTYAPFVNMLLTIGEEAGWRGTMYPELKVRFGETKGRVLGGIIWGIWHWPIMLLAGYEYGTAYWGAPITGPLLFCIITVAMGMLNQKDILIAALSGDTELGTVTADTIDLSSSSGSIRADRISAQSLKCSASSGSMDVGAASVKALDCSTSSGDVTMGSMISEVSSVTTGSGNVKLSLADVPSAEIYTSGGDVDLTLPTGGAEVLYTTSGGNLLTDRAYDRKGDLCVFGEGTSTITVGTSSGNLRIQ